MASAACFDIQGEYFVTYPGPGQFYLALSEALYTLSSGRITIALVGAVADQTNFLVAHHYQRLQHRVPASDLRDAAGFLIFERAAEHAARRGPSRGRLLDLKINYSPHDPFGEEPDPAEEFVGCARPDGEFGTASLAVALARSRDNSKQTRTVRHQLRTRDGLTASSAWELA